MLDPVYGLLIVTSFAILFASAAAHKWHNLGGFDEVFQAYGLLPHAPSLRISWAVPLVESALALGLLSGSTRSYAAALGIVLLLSYAGAIALNLWRGRRDIACGCGGPDRRPIAAWMVWRNLLLALLLAGALCSWRTRALRLIDYFTIGFGVVSIVVIYLCLDRLGQIARQAQTLRELS
jgi:hypothetical protein